MSVQNTHYAPGVPVQKDEPINSRRALGVPSAITKDQTIDSQCAPGVLVQNTSPSAATNAPVAPVQNDEPVNSRCALGVLAKKTKPLAANVHQYKIPAHQQFNYLCIYDLYSPVHNVSRASHLTK